VGASIRTHRFHLRKLIDEDKPKPPEICEEFWQKLVDDKGTKEAQEKSMTMASITKNRGQRNTTRKKIEQAMTLQLVRSISSHVFAATVLVMLLLFRLNQISTLHKSTRFLGGT
jgi:hypothetical protein